MSLILDALSRSRSDASSVPGVETYHTLEDLTPTWRRYLPWVALVVAVLLIAALLLDRAGLFPRTGKEQGALSVPVAAAPVQAPAPVPAPAPAARPAPDPRPVSVPAPKPVAAAVQPLVEVQTAEESAAEAAVADLYRSRDRERVEQQDASAESLSRQPSQEPAQAAPGSSKVKEQPVNLEEMLEQARTQMGDDEFVEHSAPFIGSLSQQTRNPIPTILYQRHDYSGQTARASVVMNGKTLRAGGSPVAGVKIDEILPNSTVLNYRGTQFRLRALNSWVNL